MFVIFNVSSPKPERGPPGEQDGFGFGLGLLKEPEEGVILHTDLPEDLAAVPAGHGELQGVVMRVLLEEHREKVRTQRKKRDSWRKGHIREGQDAE